jgi:hypothetical protein
VRGLRELFVRRKRKQGSRFSQIFAKKRVFLQKKNFFFFLRFSKSAGGFCAPRCAKTVKNEKKFPFTAHEFF